MGFLRYFLWLVLFAVAASSIGATIEQLPSKSFRETFNPERHAGTFMDLDKEPKKRVKAFINAWGHATQSSSVDNRSYLFALAIDLYNTIPPDLMPEPRELGPDEDVYEPNLAPIKAQLYANLRGLKPEYANPPQQKQALWEYMKEKLSPKRQAASIEIKYLKNYITDQIEKSNITIDAHDAPASLPPEKLDITNPTYYKPLRDYMERMQPAIEARVPPWEAEKYLATERGDEKPEQDKATAREKPVVKPEPKSLNETADPHAAEEATYRQNILILALLAIGVAVIAYIILRPRKK